MCSQFGASYCGGSSCSNGCYCCTDSCSGGCGNNCQGTCSGGCNTTCTGSCANGCSGCGSGCASGCSGCGSGCASGCSGCGSGCATGCSGCGSGCASTCTGGCKNTCKNTCTNACTACTGTCKEQCDNGCTSTSFAETYARLTISNIIYDNEINDLINLLISELTRRGYSANSSLISNIYVMQNLYNNLSTDFQKLGKSISGSSVIVNKTTFTEFINFLKDIYDNIIVL